jgi:hypothetical protein
MNYVKYTGKIAQYEGVGVQIEDFLVIGDFGVVENVHLGNAGLVHCFVEILFVKQDGVSRALGFNEGAQFGGGVNEEIDI